MKEAMVEVAFDEIGASILRRKVINNVLVGRMTKSTLSFVSCMRRKARAEEVGLIN
jgi:hypothetical protein